MRPGNVVSVQLAIDQGKTAPHMKQWIGMAARARDNIVESQYCDISGAMWPVEPLRGQSTRVG